MNEQDVNQALAGIFGSDAIDALILTADELGEVRLRSISSLWVTLKSSTDVTDANRFRLEITP